MAAISVADLKLIKSGGTGNENPNNSLGGVISTASLSSVENQSFTAPSLVTGVVIKSCGSNPIGAGLLRWDVGTQVLYWKPYGNVAYYGLKILTSGTYYIGSPTGYIIVEVTFGALPGTTQQDSITIGYATNNAFDNISPLNSLVGAVDYRCFYLKNTHSSSTALDVKLWVKSQPLADDRIDIGVDPAGVGNGSTTGIAKTIADEVDSTNVLPSGTPVVFSRPASSAAGLDLGDIPSGSCAAFWIKRTVPAESIVLQNNDTCSLGIAATL